MPALAADEAIVASLVLAADAARFQRGLDFGAAEAAHTAKLMRRSFRIGEGGSIVISIGPAAQARKVAASGRPILAVLTDEGSAGPAFRISPSAAERAAAIARLAAGDEAARAVAWHPSLGRYGAGELNERFVRTTGKLMDEAAWLGWLATKIALESALRGRPLSAARVDGHKGRALVFNDARVLEQPLYVVTTRNGREVVLA